VQALVAASPSVSAILKRAGAAGSHPAVLSVAAHEVTTNRLNQLIVETGVTGHGTAGGEGAGGGAGGGGADAAALASTSAAVSVGVFDSAAAAAAGKLLRRGSLVFAAADIGAKPWRSLPDPVLFATGQRRDRAGTGGRPASAAFSAPPSAASSRRQSMFARLITGSTGPAPGSAGAGGGEAAGAGLASPPRPRSVKGHRASSPGFTLPPSGTPDLSPAGRGTPDSAAGAGGRTGSPVLGIAATAGGVGAGRGGGGGPGGGWYNPVGAQGAIANTSSGNAVGPKVRRFRRRMRVVSRWEELSGNMPRWALSVVDEHRLKHTPIFAPVVGLGPGQAGYVDPLASFMQTVGEAGEGVAGVFGGIAAMIATGGRQRKKEDGKKRKDTKAKAGGGGGDEDDEDDDDEEEEDDDEEEEAADDVDAGDEAGAVFSRLAAANDAAASAAPASAGPSTPAAVVATRGDKAAKAGAGAAKAHRGGMLVGSSGGETGGVMSGPGVGPAGLAISDIEAMDRVLGGKRLARELRGRLACMRARVTFAELNNPSAFHSAGGASAGGAASGGYVGPPVPAITPEATAVTALQATALQLMAARGNVDAEMVSLQLGNADSGSSLAGARGRERALLLSLTQRERGHLTAMRSQAEEYAKLGWDVKVGVPSLPQSAFHSTVTRSATGVTLLVTPRSRTTSIAAGACVSHPAAHVPPPPLLPPLLFSWPQRVATHRRRGRGVHYERSAGAAPAAWRHPLPLVARTVVRRGVVAPAAVGRVAPGGCSHLTTRATRRRRPTRLERVADRAACDHGRGRSGVDAPAALRAARQQQLLLLQVVLAPAAAGHRPRGVLARRRPADLPPVGTLPRRWCPTPFALPY